MIEILATMAQIALVVVVSGVVCGGAAGLIASEVALWWHGGAICYEDRKVSE